MFSWSVKCLTYEHFVDTDLILHEEIFNSENKARATLQF